MEPSKNSLEYIKKSFELKNSKLYKEAIEMLYKALEYDEGKANAETISQIGDLYLLLKNPDRALEEYEKALDIDKNHSHSLEQMCNIYFTLGKYTRALEISQKLAETNPNVRHIANHLKILFKLNNFDKMKSVYEGLEENLKNNAEILYIISKTELYPKIELLKKAVEADKGYTPAAMDLALEYFKEEDIENAQKYFDKVLQKDQNPAAYFYLGLIEHQKGNFFAAIKNYLNCLKRDKANDKCYFELAKAYIDINWLKEAQIALKGSISLLKLKNLDHPNALDAHHFLLGWILSREKDKKNAKLYLDMIDENSVMYPNAQILKSTLNLNSDTYISAKNILEGYYKNNPEEAINPILVESLGKIYKKLKMYKEGIELFQNALKHFPDSIFYALELIDLLIDDKNYNEALQMAKHLEQTAPKCPNTHNSFARIYYRLKNYEGAIEHLKTLTKLDPNNAEGFYFLGLVQNDTCLAQEALENLRIALTLNPRPAKYYAQTARAYETLGDLINAMLYIKEAVEIAPEEIDYVLRAKNIAQKMKDFKKEKFYQSQISRLEKILKAKKN